MKDKALIIFILLSIFCFNNCKNQDHFPINKDRLIIVDTIPLKKVNNIKWNANKATQIGMHKIDSTIEKFQSLKRQDFKNLGALLSKETSAIVKNCDMTGEAHDQLHLVLVPILEQILVLKEDHDITDKNTAVKNIENLIGVYHRYFND